MMISLRCMLFRYTQKIMTFLWMEPICKQRTLMTVSFLTVIKMSLCWMMVLARWKIRDRVHSFSKRVSGSIAAFPLFRSLKLPCEPNTKLILHVDNMAAVAFLNKGRANYSSVSIRAHYDLCLKLHVLWKKIILPLNVLIKCNIKMPLYLR